MSGDAQVAEHTGLGRLAHGLQQAAVHVGDLATQVDERVVAANGARRDRDALNEDVRVAHDERDVLAGARLGLVSVHHEIAGTTISGGQEGPLEAGGETGAATAS